MNVQHASTHVHFNFTHWIFFRHSPCRESKKKLHSHDLFNAAVKFFCVYAINFLRALPHRRRRLSFASILPREKQQCTAFAYGRLLRFIKVEDLHPILPLFSYYFSFADDIFWWAISSRILRRPIHPKPDSERSCKKFRTQIEQIL